MLEDGFYSADRRKPLYVLNKNVINTKQWSKVVALKLYRACKSLDDLVKMQILVQVWSGAW